MLEARAIVLKAHPDTVTDQELEKEKGGSGLRYSFDIKDGKTAEKSPSMPRQVRCWRTPPKARIPARISRHTDAVATT